MKYIQGQVNWGIIGAGNVCEKKSGPAFNQVPDSKLLAVMRRNKDKAEDFARRHNVPRFYDNVDELLADKEINAVYIATPPVYHLRYAEAAAKAGKAVYIEKPVCMDTPECEKLIHTADHTRVPMSVAHYRRRLPMFLKIKELIDVGQLGDIMFIDLKLFQDAGTELIANSETNWRIIPELSGGGLFHDLAPHQLDILCWLFGEPCSFSGYSFNQGEKYNAPDVVRLDARFADKVFFNGLWSFNMSDYANEDICRIIGEKGELRFSFFRNPALIFTNGTDKEEFVTEIPDPIQLPLITDIVKYFKGELKNPASIHEAMWTMQMMDCTLV
jgi:predicted dehydrogenase